MLLNGASLLQLLKSDKNQERIFYYTNSGEKSPCLNFKVQRNILLKKLSQIKGFIYIYIVKQTS